MKRLIDADSVTKTIYYETRRKSVNSTLITKFNSVFKPGVYYEPFESASVCFAAEGAGNLYLKDN